MSCVPDYLVTLLRPCRIIVKSGVSKMDNLTPEECTELRKLLKDHHAQDAPFRIVERLPIVGKYLGMVGRRYWAFLSFVGGIASVLLLPADIRDISRTYGPPVTAMVSEFCVPHTKHGLNENPCPPMPCNWEFTGLPSGSPSTTSSTTSPTSATTTTAAPSSPYYS